jgi:uncharacterized membrane protein
MIRIERKKGFKLSVWTAVTVFVAVGLISKDRGTVSVVCGVFIVAVGVLTIVLILTGNDPRWTETRKVRRASKGRERSS